MSIISSLLTWWNVWVVKTFKQYEVLKFSMLKNWTSMLAVRSGNEWIIPTPIPYSKVEEIVTTSIENFKTSCSWNCLYCNRPLAFQTPFFNKFIIFFWAIKVELARRGWCGVVTSCVRRMRNWRFVLRKMPSCFGLDGSILLVCGFWCCYFCT